MRAMSRSEYGWMAFNDGPAKPERELNAVSFDDNYQKIRIRDNRMVTPATQPCIVCGNYD